MRQTPTNDGFNPDLLNAIPDGLARIVEVGCGTGALARAYLANHPDCHYTGIEIEPAYTQVARGRCTRVLTGNIESFGEAEFAELGPVDCWVFGDVLEHLYDPWRVLRDIRRHASPTTRVLACVPNAQHWSIQARLSVGDFRYQDNGLLDRTHIRWFTLQTLLELFRSSGFTVLACHPRILDEPGRDKTLSHIYALAKNLGANPDIAVRDSLPVQYVVDTVVTA